MNSSLKKIRIALILTVIVMIISAVNMVAGGFGGFQTIIFLATIIIFRSQLVQYRAARKKDEDDND